MVLDGSRRTRKHCLRVCPVDFVAWKHRVSRPLTFRLEFHDRPTTDDSGQKTHTAAKEARHRSAPEGRHVSTLGPQVYRRSFLWSV